LSYKIGELEILKIRKVLTEELGNKFNIKVFHKAVLDCIGPLDLLEECVRWRVEEKGIDLKVRTKQFVDLLF